MKTLIRLIIAVIILAVFSFGAMKIASLEKDVKRRSKPKSLPVVELAPLKKVDLQIRIPSQGVVLPRRVSSISSLMGGRVVHMTEGLQEGFPVKKGQVLFRLNDLEAKLRVAESKEALANSQLLKDQEEERQQQAKARWLALEIEGKASRLALREPQLEKAKAAIESAKARLRKAEDDLRETQILAPHDGIIQQYYVEVEEVVSPGQRLAELVDISSAKIHLQISDEQLQQLRAPTTWGRTPLTIQLGLEQDQKMWDARGILLLPSLDTNTRRWVIMAEVENPLNQKPPLAMNQFVTANLFGKKITGVFAIPEELVNEEGVIFSVDETQRLVPHLLKPIWKQDGFWWVKDGLSPGLMICRTSLPFATQGLQVRTLKNNRLPEKAPASKESL